MNNNEQGEPITIKINRTYVLTPDSHTLFEHDPILHSISKRQRSPSNADRNMLGDEVGISDGIMDGGRLGHVVGDEVGSLDGVYVGRRLGTLESEGF